MTTKDTFFQFTPAPAMDVQRAGPTNAKLVEYLLVSDKDSQLLKSSTDYDELRELAGLIHRAGGQCTIWKRLIRRAGGQCTIFKATEG